MQNDNNMSDESSDSENSDSEDDESELLFATFEIREN